MAGTPFLGVELPDKFETNSSESAPEVSEASDAADNAPEEQNDTSDKPEPKVDKPAQAAKPDFLDLDKHERVRFKGKEWSTKDLIDSQFRHEDYTRKVQLAKEEAKYASNFEADLDAVVENPALMSELKKIYPPRYVKVAEKVLANIRQNGTAAPQGEKPSEVAQVQQSLDPDTQKKLEELLEFKSTLDQRAQEAKVQADLNTVNEWFGDLSKKYPNAHEGWVNAQAAFLAERLEDNGKTLTKADVEKLFKEDHDAREKWYVDRSRAQIKEQKAAAKKGQDMGAGGGVPSAPSQKPKNFKEARALMESDLESGRLS